jgi:hypothetical protein
MGESRGPHCRLMQNPHRLTPAPLTFRSAARHLSLLGGLAAVLGLSGCGKPATSADGKSSATTSATAPAAPAPAAAKAAVPETVQKLLGRWVRSDGGYTLELRSADLSGVLDAGYFNPKSIRVSRAVWMQGGGGYQVAVELNDVGYPGATYLLTYEPQTDKLVGKYTQPQMQQTFDIEFVRQPR